MAKTRISEIMKNYGIEKSDVASFLKEHGIEVKTASSSVDEDVMKLVDAHFGGKKNVTEQAAEDKKSAAKQEPSAGAEEKAVHKVANPVKKKKIIIVTGGNANKQHAAASYSAGGQGRQNASGNNNNVRPARGNQQAAGNQGAYRPIKPKTAPSQMNDDYRRSEQKTAAAVKKPMPEKAAAPEMAAVKAEETKAAAVEKAVAPVNAAPKVEEPAVKVAPVQEEPAAKAPVQESSVKAVEKEQQAHKEEPAKEPAKKQTISSIADSTPTIIIHKHYEGYGSSANSNNNNNRGNGGFNRNGQRQGNGQGNGQNRRFGQNNGQNDRGQRGYAGQGGQNDRGQNDRGRGQGRPGFAARPGQGGSGRPSAQGSRNFGGNGGASAAPDFGNAASGKRRNQAGNGRDRHNKKDMAFEQNEQRERKNRSGRFIKPVVEKVEEPEEQIKVISIPEKLTIGDLADAMHMKAAELIKKLFLAGKAMTVNSEVTYEEAENIASDYDILCEKEEKVDVIQELLKEDEDLKENLVDRAPVVCVMGHVDHGKTSILDYIRHSRVTEKEAGGITQAIGAYTVTMNDRTITFLDTPGHEAFTAMRLRGAQSTDIAVLVVAADDGVMPQTVEAINHAKAAGVEIIVAVNKMDKADANPDRVKEQLSKYELIPADWGGQTEFVNVSAKTGEGIDDLLDTILLQADVMELKANPDRLARGLVLEAKLDRGRGPVANVLVQKGTLHVGDFISAGPAFGKVRAMINDKGKNVKEAGPSEPVVVLGLSDVPGAGEVIVAHPDNDEAKSYAQTYKAQHKEELVEENVMSMNVEDLFDQMREGKMKELELIVKADVQGSVEALCASLQKLSNDEVKVRIIHSAAGNITESDVDLAAASNAAIIGFNVQPASTAKSIAEHNGVSIHLYKVIYQAIDDVNAALNGMLAPVYEEKVIGHAEVRQLFKSGKIGNIAGSMVLDGVIEKGCTVRITRDKEQIFEGALASLKRFKDDVKEVKAGYDCGLVFEDFDGMNVGDQIEAYKMVEVPKEEVIARKEREAAKKAKENA